MLATDLEHSRFFDEVLTIYRIAESLHQKIDQVPDLVQTRQKGDWLKPSCFCGPYKGG